MSCEDVDVSLCVGMCIEASVASVIDQEMDCNEHCCFRWRGVSVSEEVEEEVEARRATHLRHHQHRQRLGQIDTDTDTGPTDRNHGVCHWKLFVAGWKSMLWQDLCDLLLMFMLYAALVNVSFPTTVIVSNRS